MASQDTEFWERARQARDKLAAQWLNHPAVSLIDLGYDPQDNAPAQHIVLRVHLRRPEAEPDLGLPAEIDGIPVRVIIAGYRLE